MSTLKFVCPATGLEVDTGVEVAETTFNMLGPAALLLCPHCPEPHALAGVQAWLEE
jgi:hypothetical protein